MDAADLLGPSNMVRAKGFIPYNEWCEHTFDKVVYAMRQYLKELCVADDVEAAAEMITTNWVMPSYDNMSGEFTNVEPEERGVELIVEWVVV